MSQAWLKPVPAPRTRHEVRDMSPSGSHRRDRLKHPLPSAKGVCGAECAGRGAPGVSRGLRAVGVLRATQNSSPGDSSTSLYAAWLFILTKVSHWGRSRLRRGSLAQVHLPGSRSGFTRCLRVRAGARWAAQGSAPWGGLSEARGVGVQCARVLSGVGCRSPPREATAPIHCSGDRVQRCLYTLGPHAGGRWRSRCTWGVL